jgi:hypothetical protein
MSVVWPLEVMQITSIFIPSTQIPLHHLSQDSLTSTSNSSVSLTSSLHIVGIHTGRRSSRKTALAGLLSTVEVDVLKIEGVDVTRNIAQEGQANVDEQIHSASRDCPYTDGREEESNEDEENCRNAAHGYGLLFKMWYTFRRMCKCTDVGRIKL